MDLDKRQITSFFATLNLILENLQGVLADNTHAFKKWFQSFRGLLGLQNTNHTHRQLWLLIFKGIGTASLIDFV